MAVTQSQIAIPSNGSQVVVFGGQLANSNQLSLRNTGSNTILIGPASFISPPLNFTGTPGTGGTFTAGTYHWVITSTNALGETTQSIEVNSAIAASGTMVLTWTVAPGATGYKIYRSTTSGGETTSPALVTTIGSGATVTYTDTGIGVLTGAAPASNTASVPVVFPLATNEFLGLTVTTPDDIIVAQVQTAGTAGQITTLTVG